MSKSKVSEPVKCLLWGKAAGRCQYDGCSKPLWKDDLTLEEYNIAYVGHIVGDSAEGPRGSEELSDELGKDISNLMLLCDDHHRLIDRHKVEEHSPKRLGEMKRTHEERIEILTSINPNKKSHILLYGAKVGDVDSILTYKEASVGMLPHWYPASRTPLALGLQNPHWNDRDKKFWEIEEPQLINTFARDVERGFRDGSVQHVSVFALAPIPLLIKLGTLLTDIRPVEVYQRHREPQTWQWQEMPQDAGKLVIKEPTIQGKKAVLNLSLSATIDDVRITSVLGDDISIWTMTLKVPSNSYLRSREQLRHFREEMRLLFDRMKSVHGQDAELHIFPAIPVSIGVELGRVWQPKADMQMRIYDQNSATGGFSEAITISNHADKSEQAA